MKTNTDTEIAAITEFRAMALLREVEAKVRRHEAAGFGRRYPRENDLSSTPVQEQGAEGNILRRRSHNLISNNGYGGNAQSVVANNVVGGGIRPSVKKRWAALEETILQEWEAWADYHNCDFEERENFYAIQQKVIRTVFESGEAIIRRRRNADGSIQLQVHEAEFIDDSKGSIMDADGRFTMNGIEYTQEGKVAAYWLFDDLDEPFMGNIQSRRIEAANITHIFYADRPGQRRGLPWLRRAYMALMDITRFMDADLQRAIIAACHAVFISGNPAAIVGFNANDPEERIDRLQPGAIDYLQPGEQVTFNTPPAHNNFEAYVRAILRQVAAAIGITYESLSMDYSQVNFSSGRMGWIEASRNFDEKRLRVMKYFNDRAWEWFMESLAVRGVLKMTREQARMVRADWTPPRREMLDPVKEVEGQRLMVAAGFKSPQEVIRESGGDPEDVNKEIAEAIKEMDKIGFVPTWNVPTHEMHALAIEADAKQTSAENIGKNRPTK